MCGIVGVINLSIGAVVDKKNLSSMLQKIRHRGPDDDGIYLSTDESIGFGAARLSFLDFEHGIQPMRSACGQGVIAYNGEVYDVAAGKDDMTKQGCLFKTRTDTEYVLNHFLAHGIDGLVTLNGEFAFAVHDRRDDSVTLVRDRFGTKPLYYMVHDQKLLFASEMKALLTYPGIPRRFNSRYIFEHFFRADSLERTLIEGVHVLKAGHCLRIKSGDFKIVRYWDLQLPTSKEERDNTTSLSDYVTQLHACLEQAVQRRMVSDVEIGAFLSGGLDSSLLSALMQRQVESPIKTFSIRFEDAAYDESAHAACVAEHIGSEHHVVSLSTKDLTHNYPRALYHCEHLTQQIDGTGKYLLAAQASKSVKGIIVGEGADELFLGYPWFKMAKYVGELKQYETIAAMETARQGLDLTLYNHQDMKKYQDLFGYYPMSIGNILCMNDTFGLSLFSDDFKQQIADLDATNIYQEDLDPSRLQGLSPIRQNQYEFIKKTLDTYLFKFLGDKVEMASSIESRLPFFDRDVVAMAAKIPEQYLLNGLSEKYILKQVAKSYLPDNIIKRVKHGYSAPILQGFLEEGRPDYYVELMQPQVIQEIGIFNPEEVKKLLTACKKRQGMLDQKTTVLERAAVFVLSVQLMHRMIIENKAHLYQ